MATQGMIGPILVPAAADGQAQCSAVVRTWAHMPRSLNISCSVDKLEEAESLTITMIEKQQKDES